MAVKRRLSWYSGQRADISHLRTLESSVSYDVDSILRNVFTGISRPYLIKGFRIKYDLNANKDNIQIEVAGSAVLHSTATESGTILTVPEGTSDEILSPSNTKLVGAFQASQINYIALDYRRITDTTTIDQTAGWSASQKIEYQRTVPTGRLLDYRFVVTANGFGTNLPLYIVKLTSTGAVEWITKGAPSLFRLGSGGANPNPLYSYNFGGITNPQTGNRREWVQTASLSTSNPMTVVPGADSLAFDYGDYSIGNFKDWMDAVMTRIKELSSSQYWYLSSLFPAGEIKSADSWWDANGSVMTGAGAISYNLVLESGLVSNGRLQSTDDDNTILPGDSYLEGASSGAKATMSFYTGTQLVINSVGNVAFLFSETLYNRRKSRLNQALARLTDFSVSPNRYATYERLASSSGSAVGISSWSYTNINGSDLFFSIIDITTSAPHGRSVGDQVEILGLVSTTNAPNGSAFIKEILSSTQFRIHKILRPTGPATVGGSNSVKLDNPTLFPYMPKHPITSWSFVGTACTLTVPNHTFRSPITSLTGDTTNLSQNIINISSTSDIRLGMAISGTNIPSGSIVTKIISATSIEISQQATGTTTGVALTLKDTVIVSGLTAATNAPNGRFTINGFGLNASELQITAAIAPTGTPGTSNALMRPDVFDFPMTVTGSTTFEYNVINQTAYSISDSALYFKVGLDTLPILGVSGGPVQFDGVVAISTVKDPVRISQISTSGSDVVVDCYTPHGYIGTVLGVDITIYGDSTLSGFIRTYTGIDIQAVTTTQFKILGGNLSLPTYINPGSDNTFASMPNNPYPGPVTWSSDIVIKGIIGDKSFSIPESAVADTVNGSPDANRFNTGGRTGTIFLKDGEVAYLQLDRGEYVSSSAAWSANAGRTLVSGSTPPVDINGSPLQAGDFVKFADEDETKWLRITGVLGTQILTNSFSLINDRNQSPDNTSYPAKSGPMVYAKGSYSLLQVRQHYKIPASGNVWWLAVRRDNGGQIPKVYFRALELEPGEVRQINDNEPSNLLIYTGAFNEAAVAPMYSTSDATGEYQYTKPLTISAVDSLTRMITLSSDVEFGYQQDDRIVKAGGGNYTIKEIISSVSVVVDEDISGLSVLDSVTYYRYNKNIDDSDNLTKAIRKEDRQIGRIDTALKRPIYDESAFVQQINLSGSGTVRSGSYIYTGTQTNPTALAWVLHGNAAVTETIESSPVAMPGGHSSVGPNAILVNIVFGAFSHGAGILQNGALTGRTVNNPSNPPFTAPALSGGTPGNGLEMVLPPNKRTQVIGSLGDYLVYGTHAFYKASVDPLLKGEELLVVANGLTRESGIDYEESFGGPKAKVRLLRDLPPNTRIRFRTLASYGSALGAKPADVSLQTAYNAGATIQTAPARPVEITSSDVPNGAAGLVARGSVQINGGPTALGGIFNETTDQSFVVGKETDKPKEVWSGVDAVKTHSSHPGSALRRKTAAQTVTGPSGTIITGSTLTLNDNTTYRIKLNATGRRSDGTFGVASFTLEGTFYRDSASTATAAGSPISTINGADGDGNLWAVVFGLSGNDVIAVVYGTSGSTIQWAVSVEWQAVNLAS